MALTRDKNATNLTMYAGDTGSFYLNATRLGGADWTENDRMQLTVASSSGEIVLQRWYRLDDDDGLGNGVILVQFHNADTKNLAPGTYSLERRYSVNPGWKTGSAPAGKCVNALTSGNEMIGGDIVDTVIQGTLNILAVTGKI